MAAGGGCTPGGGPMLGVSDVATIGDRGGMAATVGGSEPVAFLASSGAATAAAAAAARGTAACGAGVAVVEEMSRTTPAARSASRRLRSSETLSVGEVRDAF